MAEQRQMFRFRIPWLSAAPPAPQPVPQPLVEPEPARSAPAPPAFRPVAPSIGPRPPFRPPGIGSPPPVRYDEASDRQPAFRIRPPSRPASESGTASQPTTPPRTPPRSQTTSLSPPPSRVAAFPGRPVTMAPPASPPARNLPEQEDPPPPPAPSAIRDSLLRIPSSQPTPPPRPQEEKGETYANKSSPTMTTKFEPTVPTQKVVSEAQRASHRTPHREHGKGLAEASGEKKPEKGPHGPFKRDKTQKSPKHLHEGKHRTRIHHNLHTPAGGSSSSSNAVETPLQKGIKDDITKLVHKLTAGHAMKHQLGQNQVNVITLAGENQGASMHLSSDHPGEGSVHIHRGYKTDPDESTEHTAEEGEGALPPSDEENTPPEAYINSNVQGVNNSIMLEGSVTERNPGVHVVMSAEEEEELPPVHPESGTTPELGETRRSEFSPTPAERLTYEPVIRRRCLRGLFMESSDSETDDPSKPRRHGCRYVCGARIKDKDVNIL